MRIASITRLALAAAVCATVACGGDSSTGPKGVDANAFSGTVTGDYTRTLTGAAAAGHETDPDYGDIYAIVLSDGAITDTASGAVVLSHVGSGVSQKTYDVADFEAVGQSEASNPFGDKFFAMYAPSSTSGINDLFFTSGGTVTISTVSATRVKGTFDVTMKNAIVVPGTSAKSIRVRGTFDAPVGTAPVTSRTSRAAVRLQAERQALR